MGEQIELVGLTPELCSAMAPTKPHGRFDICSQGGDAVRDPLPIRCSNLDLARSSEVRRSLHCDDQTTGNDSARR